MSVTVREPSVAGAFYPLAAADLERQLDTLVETQPERHQLLACISPHAGYVYSGGVAGRLFGHLELPRRVVVLGPNHTGAGFPVAVAPHRQWSTPLGPVKVDRDLAERLVRHHPTAEFDDRAHWREHSVEVQLPFLVKRRPDIEVLPVCLQHLSVEDCLRLGAALADLVTIADQPVGIVASSDMTHYQPDAVARKLDQLAIDATLERDPRLLYDTVHREGITMCGVIPATVALEAANRLGATDAHLVAYSTSGETSGDFSAVVGYAGICVHE